MIFLLFLLLAVPAVAADPLENLIENEQNARQEWGGEIGSLPLAYMWGNQTGVKIYDPSEHDGRGNILCESLEFDELIEMSQGNPLQARNVLNTDLRRVRELLETNCLIRPDETLMAVGPGWQKKISAHEFIVERGKSPCAEDSPYSLWMSLDASLPGVPLFFTTADNLFEGNNGYLKLTEKVMTSKESLDRSRFETALPDVAEFTIARSGAFGPNIADLFHLRRKTISLDDDQLPNEILLWDSGTEIKTLWVERVDVKKGSGHLRSEASFDFNQDGLVDLLISGDHNGCPYRMVFEGSPDGFVPIELPIKPCKC